MWSQLLQDLARAWNVHAQESSRCRCSLRRRRVGPPGARIGGRILLLLPTFADKRRQHGKCGAEAERAWHSASEVLKARGTDDRFLPRRVLHDGRGGLRKARRVRPHDAGERPDPTETRGWDRIRKIWEETARGRLSIPRSTRDLPAIPRLTPILSFSLSSTCPCCRQAFLEFTRSRGNDLSSPAPQYGFPGLRPGDFWCLCASRWQEAFESGAAPQVVLESTHEAALRYCKLEDLQENAFVEDTIEL